MVIWDPLSGMRTLQFTAYANSTEWERTVDNAVTAMCLDPTRRKLATGNAQVNYGVRHIRVAVPVAFFALHPGKRRVTLPLEPTWICCLHHTLVPAMLIAVEKPLYWPHTGNRFTSRNTLTRKRQWLHYANSTNPRVNISIANIHSHRGLGMNSESLHGRSSKCPHVGPPADVPLDQWVLCPLSTFLLGRWTRPFLFLTSCTDLLKLIEILDRRSYRYK